MASNNIKNAKWSKYNISLQVEEGLLVYNTLSKELVLFSGKSFEPNNPYADLTKTNLVVYFPMLVEKGIVIDETYDEIKYCEYKYYEKAFSDYLLDLTIIPYEGCNFRCKYCYENLRNGKMSKDIQNRIVRYLYKEVRHHRELALDWFGGEPLLAKDIIIQIMHSAKKVCRENGVVLSSTIVTNGYELDLETFKSLIDNGVRYFHISLDGDKNTHNYQRPHVTDPDSYSKILYNLSQISKNVITGKNKFSIDIRMNVSDYIISAANTFMDVFEKHFKDDPRFNIVWQWVRNWGGDRIKESGFDQLLVTEETCKELYDKSLSRGLQSDERLSCNSGREFCGAMKKNGFVIDYDGSIYKCSMAKYKESLEDSAKIGYIDAFGNLLIDEHKNERWITVPQRTKKCDDCVFYPICMASPCPLGDNILSGKERCLPYKSMIYQQMKNRFLQNKYIAIT